jgi:hypothetical protein
LTFGKKMRCSLVILAVVGVLSGCTQLPRAIAPERRINLEQYLDARFEIASVPKDRDADFYQILDLFAAERSADQFVRSVKFVSASEAKLSFSGKPHGGGEFTFTKTKGQWTISERFWLVTAPPLQKRPNQAPEPTALAVTISACAELAPASAVAHL